MKRIILIIGLCLCLNIFAEDIIDYDLTVTWYMGDDLTITSEGSINAITSIWAPESGYFIQNFGEIISNNTAIYADLMSGDITNYKSISSGLIAIVATRMIGNIYNHDTIMSSINCIDASNMEGDIINYNGATISGTFNGIYALSMEGTIENYGTIISDSGYGIYAFGMSGDIINHGSIEGYDDYGIDASNMSGSIYNYGLIYAYDDYAIDASSMSGNIVNGIEGEIISEDGVAMYLSDFTETLYNYGLIESENNSRAIWVGGGGDNTLNLVGNGTIIGEIYFNSSNGILNITNDMDTLLDLSQAPLVEWSRINLLGGEILLTEINAETTDVYQSGTDTYVHLGIENSDVNYFLDAGTMNSYFQYSPFGYSQLGELWASEGSTIEFDFGEEDIDYIYITNTGSIATGAILKFTPQEIIEIGWSGVFNILSGEITVSEDVIYEVPLLYTVQLSTYQIPENQIVINYDEDYYVEISRKDESYSDYAHYYNESVAKYIDTNRNYEDMPEEAEDLLLELEQALTADELNALLEPYNMVGYASLANNNINWINNRTRNLFNVLSNNIGSETSVSNGSIGSSYATANTNLNRDFNGNNIWVDVYMSDNTLDGEAGFEQESDGYEVAFGIDKEINTSMILGLSLNISDFESDITGGLPVNVESDGFGLSAYGQYSQEAINHKFAIGYTGYKNDATRAGAEADFDSNEFYMTYRVEYLIEKKSYSIVPLAGIQYAHITYEDIIEDGDVTGLKGYDYDSLQSELGVKVLKQFENLQLNAGASWLHELMDTESDATAVSGIGSFSQDAIERDEDTFRLSLGLDYQINDRINLSLDYAKEFGENSDSDSINANISFSF